MYIYIPSIYIYIYIYIYGRVLFDLAAGVEQQKKREENQNIFFESCHTAMAVPWHCDGGVLAVPWQ